MTYGEGPMDIEGKKVILRHVEGQDREIFWNLSRDPEIIKVTKGYARPITCAYQMNRQSFGQSSACSIRRIIADKESPGTGLGIIMLSHIDSENGTAEIHIKLIKSARGRGYGQDAVNTLVSYAFHELRLNCICSNILEYNTASRKLFERCGFLQENTYVSRTDQEGNCRRVCFYKIQDAF